MKKLKYTAPDIIVTELKMNTLLAAESMNVSSTAVTNDNQVYSRNNDMDWSEE